MYLGIAIIILFAGFTNPPFWTSSSSGITMDVCAFNANGDEYIDILFAGYSKDGLGELRLYINNNGSFSEIPSWVSTYKAGYQSVCVGDVDNDGDLDIAAGTVRTGVNYAYNCLFLNTGSGSFSATPVWFSADDLDTIHLQLVDIDGDGWLELVSANYVNKILVYDNNFMSGGTLQYLPENWFGLLAQTSFAISQLSINNDSNFEHMDIICAHDDMQLEDPILFNKAFEYSESGLNSPIIEVWRSQGSKPDYGFWYQCTKLDDDNCVDWISLALGNSIIAGIYNESNDEYDEIRLDEVSMYPGNENYNFMAACNIVVADIIPESQSKGPEIFVCNRGLRQFISSSGEEHEMHMAEDMLLTVNWQLSNLVAEVVWISDQKIPTTYVAFTDIDRSGVYLATKNFNISCANQTFFLDSPIERELSVSIGGILLAKNQYHLDRNTGLLSLIGDFTGSNLIVQYEKSFSLDAVCATTKENIILLNTY